MRQRRTFRGLLGPALLVCLVPGCLSLHSERPVKVLVRDAETKEPIKEAEVRLTYRTRAAEASTPTTEKTKTDGIARMTTTPNGKDALIIQASTRHTSSHGVEDPTAVERSNRPVGSRRPSRSVTFIMDVYRGPPFAVDLTIPTGLRGLIKAELQIQDDANCTLGQRNFQFLVEPTGSVMIARLPVRRVGRPPCLARMPTARPSSGWTRPQSASAG